MSSPLQERLDSFKSGTPAREILAAAAPPNMRALLRRCALVRTFNTDLLQAVLRREPTEINEDDVPTASLLSASHIEPCVSWAEDQYRVKNDECAALLSETEAEVTSRRRLCESLVAYFARQKDELERLYHLPAVEHDQALLEFNARCADAKAAYNLVL